MGFLPWFNTNPLIFNAIQTGKGVVGSVLGTQFALYRLSSTTNGSIFAQEPLYAQFPCERKQIKTRTAFENQIFDLLAFDMSGDARYLNIGDILVEYGFGTDASGEAFPVGSAYAIADIQDHSPWKVIAIRCEFTAALIHPHPTAGSADEQPPSGNVFNPNAYSGVTAASSQAVYLQNGSYKIDTTGTQSPAAIPCGLQQLNRMRDSRSPKIPTRFPETHWLMYLPMLPGIQVAENFEIRLGMGDTYIVQNPYTSDGVGLNGYILVCEKKAT